MKRIITGTAAAMVLSLTGLALAHTVVASAAPVAPAAVSDAAKQAALRTTAEGYANALLRGDGLGVTGYLSDFCADSEQGEAVYAAEVVAGTAQGATLKVTSLTVDGDRGSVSAYRVSPGAPAALRKLLSSARADAATYPWRWVDGQWVLQSCGVAPTPSMTPVRIATSIY
jgi:hypothetical protein